MSHISEFIDSGVLELYVMGITSPEETRQVEQMAGAHDEIREEIDQIAQALEAYAMTQAVQPRASVKSVIMAGVDYMERLKAGEMPQQPPLLTPASKISDYAAWLNREDMQLPEDFSGMHAKIIGATPEVTTAIFWIREMHDDETHHNERESFLIVEGTCDFTVGEEVFSLVPGDYITIPLHTPHMVKVTSEVPCKAILQRVAA